MKTIIIFILLSFLPFLLNSQNIVIVTKNNISDEDKITETYQATVRSLESGYTAALDFREYGRLTSLWLQIELLKFSNYLPHNFYNEKEVPVFVTENEGADTSMWVIQTFAKIEENKTLVFLQFKIEFDNLNYTLKTFKVIKGQNLLKIDEEKIVNLYKNYQIKISQKNEVKNLPPPPPPPFGQKDNNKANSKKSIFFKNLNLKEQEKVIILVDDNMKEIPFHLFDTFDIRVFRAESVWLKNLSDDLFKLKNLENLDIDCYDCKNLPDEFHRLKKLKELKLDMPNLGSLPNSIGSLVNLEKLILNVKDEAIPPSVVNLKSLKLLRLFPNHLKSIPSSVGKIKSLESLVIYENGSSSMNAPIKKIAINDPLPNIKKLQIKNVSFSSLNYFPNVTDLSIIHSEFLESFFENHINLSTVSFTNNKLERLPESLFNLQNLESLSFWGNSISELPSAEKFLRLKKLKYLKIFNSFSVPQEQKEELINILSKVENLKLEIK